MLVATTRPRSSGGAVGLPEAPEDDIAGDDPGDHDETTSVRSAIVTEMGFGVAGFIVRMRS